MSLECCGQDVRRRGARLLGRPRFHDGSRAEVSQREHTSLADDLFGGLGDRRDDAADSAVGGRVGHWTIRDREMRFLGEPVPFHLEQDVVHPRRRSAVERRVDQRSDDVVDLPPALADGLPHRLRMLGAQDRTVRVVVQLDVVRAPPQQNRKSVGQEEADHRLEGLRPRLDGAEWRVGPVDRSHERTHLTAAREDVEGAGFGQLSGRHDVSRFGVGELVYRLSPHAAVFPFPAPVVSRFPGRTEATLRADSARRAPSRASQLAAEVRRSPPFGAGIVARRGAREEGRPAFGHAGRASRPSSGPSPRVRRSPTRFRSRSRIARRRRSSRAWRRSR